jgi:hypothetical protein
LTDAVEEVADEKAWLLIGAVVEVTARVVLPPFGAEAEPEGSA